MDIEGWFKNLHIEDFNLNLNQFSANFAMPEAIVLLMLGVFVLLFGYRLKKIAFFVIWFLLGFNLMGFLMPMINDAVPDIASNELLQTLLPIGGGLVLAIMGFTIEKMCIGGIAFVLTMLVVLQYFGTDTTILIIGGCVAIAASILSVMLMKPATIVLTSIAGAYALTVALFELQPGIDAGVFYWPILAGAAVVGAVFQFLTTKHKK